MNKKLGQDAIYDARELGIPRMLLLGLQHLFAMFGATVLVPILVTGYGLPLSIQTTLLFAGIGTLLFHVCTKFKIPAFLGSSFAFLGGFQAVANLDSGKFAAMTGEEKLPYALGGVVVAGLLYLVLALLFKLVGAKKVMRYFPPIVTGPIIILIGLNLSGTAVTNASTCWWLALVAIAIIIVANIWGKGMIKIIPILLGVVGAYIVALIATACGAKLPGADGVMQPLINFASVKSADFVGLQKFVLAKFDVTSILVMAPIAIAAKMEHIGDVSAISSTTGKNFIEDPGLHRTLLGDGVGSMMGAFFGGCPNTTYGESVGCVAISGNASVVTILTTAILAIVIAFVAPFIAFLSTIPSCVMGGVCIALYGFIAVSGLKMIQNVDLGDNRNLFVVSVILIAGVGGLTLNFGKVTLTQVACALILGILTNLILKKRDGKKSSDK